MYYLTTLKVMFLTIPVNVTVVMGMPRKLE